MKKSSINEMSDKNIIFLIGASYFFQVILKPQSVSNG